MSTLQPVGLDGATGANIKITSGTTLKGEVPGAFSAEGLVIQVAYAETPVGNYYDLNYTLELSAIPDMFIDFKPVYATSKILLTSMISINQPHVTSFGFLRDGLNITARQFSLGPTPAAVTASDYTGAVTYAPGSMSTLQQNSNVVGGLHTVYMNWDAADKMCNFFLQQQDFDNRSNATRRYQVGVNASWGDSVRSLRINDRSSGDMRAISNLCVMEIV